MPQQSDESAAVASPNALDNEIAAFVGPSSFPSFDSEGSPNSNPPDDMRAAESNSNDQDNDNNDSDDSASNNRVAEHENNKSRKEVKLDPKVAKQLGIPISTDAEVDGGNTNKVKEGDKKNEKDSKGKVESAADDDNSDQDQEDQVENNEDLQNKKEGERNLEGFGEQEKIWLRRMPRAAFDHFSKRLRDVGNIETQFKTEKKALEEKIKTLETGRQILPESYYENPEAVVLTKEFRDAQSGLGLVGVYKNHWEQQLLAIENGEKWYDLIEDPKTGQVVIDPTPKEPDAVSKINVGKWLTSMMQQETQFQQKLGGIVEGFKGKHSEISKKIKEAEDKFLPAYSDEKSEEYKVVTTIQGELGKLGISQHNPINRMLAKSIALNLALKNYILSGMQKKEKKDGVEKDQRRAGPTDSSFSGSDKGGGKKIAPSIKDFSELGLPKL